MPACRSLHHVLGAWLLRAMSQAPEPGGTDTMVGLACLVQQAADLLLECCPSVVHGSKSRDHRATRAVRSAGTMVRRSRLCRPAAG